MHLTLHLTPTELEQYFSKERKQSLQYIKRLNKQIEQHEHALAIANDAKQMGIKIEILTLKEERNNLETVDNYQALSHIWLRSISKQFQLLAVTFIILGFLVSAICAVVGNKIAITVVLSIMTVFVTLFINNYYDAFILNPRNRLKYRYVDQTFEKEIKAATISVISYWMIVTYLITLFVVFVLVPILH